jgi:glutamine phosphoribosylpyrophosphate amidotransferase
MCGIISAYIPQPAPSDIETLKRLFVEGQIRGRHQTGLAYKVGNKVERFVVEGDGKKLVAEFDWDLLLEVETLEIIGHNRYSTSDLRYPQPIQVFQDFSLCHNGVVTQESPATWKRFGYELQTANDSELLYQASYAGNEPLTEFPTATMAVCELSVARGLRWYRNGGRPAYIVKQESKFFICSTSDIAKRAGLKGAKRMVPGVVYTPSGSTKLTKVAELIP